MGFFDKLSKTEGGYIFLSHSHRDIEKVRKIRNELEKEGFEPLCFYLKCLEEDEEIFRLITREIDAREWFMYLHSENAAASDWVQRERAYIGSTNRKKIINMDLDDPDALARITPEIIRNLRIFVSHDHRDRELAQRIIRQLRKSDYLVYSPDNLGPEPWMAQTVSIVEEASKEGCVLALMTENSMRSRSVAREVILALNSGGNVLPIIIGDTQMEGSLKILLCGHRWYRLPSQPTDGQIRDLVDAIGHHLLGRIK